MFDGQSSIDSSFYHFSCRRQLFSLSWHNAQSHLFSWQDSVECTAKSDIYGYALKFRNLDFNVACKQERRDVQERYVIDVPTTIEVCSSLYQSSGSIKINRCVLAFCCDCAHLQQRGHQCNNPMPAHRTIPLIVHEQDTQISLGRHCLGQCTSIHVAVSSRLPHQRFANMVEVLLHITPAFQYCLSLQWRQPTRNDA